MFFPSKPKFLLVLGFYPRKHYVLSYGENYVFPRNKKLCFFLGKKHTTLKIGLTTKKHEFRSGCSECSIHVPPTIVLNILSPFEKAEITVREPRRRPLSARSRSALFSLEVARASPLLYFGGPGGASSALFRLTMLS